MKVLFGVMHQPDANGVMQHTLNNPNAPSVLAFAWIGPFVGAAQPDLEAEVPVETEE